MAFMNNFKMEFDFNLEIKMSDTLKIPESSEIKLNKPIQPPSQRISNLSFHDDENLIGNFIKEWYQIKTQKRFDTVTVKQLIKPYPYKSKKKRHVKKWFDKHYKIVTYKDCEISLLPN